MYSLKGLRVTPEAFASYRDPDQSSGGTESHERSVVTLHPCHLELSRCINLAIAGPFVHAAALINSPVERTESLVFEKFFAGNIRDSSLDLSRATI